MHHILMITESKKSFAYLEQIFFQDHFRMTSSSMDDLHTLSTELAFDLIILHEEEKRQNFLENIRFLHKKFGKPILLMGEHLTEDEIAKALVAGIEGYFNSPVEECMILLKVKHLIEDIRRKQDDRKIHRIGHFIFDKARRELRNESVTHSLSRIEYDLLQLLYENRNIVISKDELISKIWNADDSASNNALSIQVSRLRTKLNDPDGNILSTVWGYGLILNVQEVQK